MTGAGAGARARVSADVCVIGGGPAGSTIAERLASLGHDVCLVDRGPSPRSHLGATLPPSILPLLEATGARDRVECAGFLRPDRTVVWWSEAEPAVRAWSGSLGFHVDRGAFDALLLENAETRGVRVLRPARAMRPVRSSGGGWTIPIRCREGAREVAARFLVDASGGRGPLGGRRARVSAPLAAMYAEWRGAADGSAAGRVEARDREWFWCAPLGRERYVAAVFLDPKRLSAEPRRSVEATYARLVQRFELFRGLRCDRRVEGVVVCDAAARYAEEPVARDFIRIGDAAVALDPLSSQGVQSAIASGLQAAVVLNTLAKYPEDAEAAVAFYRDRQRETVQRHARKAAGLYGERAAVCDRPFWQQRATFAGRAAAPVLEERQLEAACTIRLAASTVIESAPVIDRDRIVAMLTVRHENLERPVAFVGDVPIVPFLRRIGCGQTAEVVARSCADWLPFELSWRILQWLWHRRIVVAAEL